jgi:autotransporter-associated beta strand protein
MMTMTRLSSAVARMLASLAIAVSLVTTQGKADAANLYWGGGTVDIAGNGTGTAVSTAGTWNTTIQNWDVGVAPYVIWDNTTNANDTATFFGNNNYTVTVGSNITLGGLATSWSGATRTLSLSSSNSTLNFSPGSVIDNTAGSTGNYGVLNITAGISGTPAYSIRTFSNGTNTLNPSTSLSHAIGAVSMSLGAATDTTLSLAGASSTVNSIASVTMAGNGSNRPNFTKTNTSTWSIGNVVSTTSTSSARITLNAQQGLLRFTGDIHAQSLNVGNAVNDDATVELTKPGATLEIDNVTMTGGILNNTSGGALTFTTSVVDNTNNNRIGNNGIRFQGGDMVFQSNRIIKLNTNDATIDVMTAGQTVTFSGNVTQITSARNLIKAGSGTLILGGTSTYAGTTTVTGGTLAITGTGSINSSSGITIDGGTLRYTSSVNLTKPVTFTSGTLGGTNWVGSGLNNMTIGANQTISPGNSPGTANTVDQTWAGNGEYIWEINDVTSGFEGQDPGWDLLAGTGTLSITADNVTPFTIVVTSLTLGNVDGAVHNFNHSLSYDWLIADFANPVSGFAPNAFTIDTTQFLSQNPGTAGSFSIAQGQNVTGGDSSQIYLVYTAVPEPGTIALLAAGGAIGVGALRRRSKLA